ncbi:hypothetical protein [Amycolatopsis alba]|uniref:hypothetical protein n=1 Tax=Amycolatopsis alba TaxID=76020 RepID=UPI0003677421|nr:hypothetical protein [Amycolatopsis alba]
MPLTGGPQRVSTAVNGQPIDIDAILTKLRDKATLEHVAGVLMARYDLADAMMAIHALRTAALRHNVGPDALARAVLVAPRPWRNGRWFPPRVWRSAPELDFLSGSFGLRPSGLLWAALDRVTDRAQTAQGDIQSVTPSRTGLKLERAEGFSKEFFQHFAHVEGDATACGIAIRDEVSHRHGVGLAATALPPGSLPWAGLVRPSTALPDSAVLMRRLAAETLLVFLTLDDTRYDHLTAGHAVQTTWLDAVDGGLVGSVLTQPLHLPEVRSALCEDLELAGFPQALMRFGYPSGAVPASPRRAVDEVLGRGF